MKKLLIILLAIISPTASAAKKKVVKPDVSVGNLRVENLEQPLGIDTAEPRFSWQITSIKQDVHQTAYQIIVSDDEGEVWNTGKVDSDQQLWVPYAGKQLKSGTFCSWKVKVWTTAGESDWSSEECFSIGLLDEGKWSGYWIGLERLLPGEEPTILFVVPSCTVTTWFRLGTVEVEFTSIWCTSPPASSMGEPDLPKVAFHAPCAIVPFFTMTPAKLLVPP